MITGDYHHTAVAVAKTVGMVKPDSGVAVIDTLQQGAVQHEAPSPLASQVASHAAGACPLPSPPGGSGYSVQAGTQELAHNSQPSDAAVEAPHRFPTASSLKVGRGSASRFWVERCLPSYHN